MLKQTNMQPNFD